MDRIAKRPRGFAFLRYSTEEESQRAIEGMHGKGERLYCLTKHPNWDGQPCQSSHRSLLHSVLGWQGKIRRSRENTVGASSGTCSKPTDCHVQKNH
ncbi:hypothetical protein MLD38_031774 [Melastoma candidum]|uniref:Uncharacterized protein n=1 Tax=Melastoma candidum TaxID=119954 RepID=A0ACB9MU02_9MYRT|nr:hypothetical protein MLD38_031774 [Melastoma candidum]